MTDKRDETEPAPVSQALMPRNLFEWVLLFLIAGLTGGLAFGVGLWVGGFIWGV